MIGPDGITAAKALADKIVAGDYSFVTRHIVHVNIARTMGWRQVAKGWVNPHSGAFHKVAPEFLYDLQHADSLFNPLRDRGWAFNMTVERSGRTSIQAAKRQCFVEVTAPEERRARIALAILALVDETELANEGA